MRLNLTQRAKTHPNRTLLGLTDSELFLDSEGGGAWPFLVRGVICLVDSDNERDSSLLNRGPAHSPGRLLRGTGGATAARDRAITGL